MAAQPEQLSTEAMLEEISSSRVCATLTYSRVGLLSEVAVGLPGVPSFEGTVDRRERQILPEMFLHHLEVPAELRQNGIATRLISSMAYIAKSHHLPVLHSVVSSQHTLRAFRKLFGDESICLFDAAARAGVGHFPVSVEHAIASLERAQAFEKDLDDRRHDIGFRINLGGIALSSLEEPVVYT